MRRIALISFLSFISLVPFARGNSIIDKDRAVFRVETKPYFVAELSPMLKAFGRFRCLKKSLLVEFLQKTAELESSKFNDSELPFDLEELRKRDKELQLILTLLKIRSFIPGTSLSFRPEILSNLKFNTCYKNIESMDAIDKEYLYLEVYLRNRFSGRSKSRQTESLHSFLDSVLKKVNYELYY